MRDAIAPAVLDPVQTDRGPASDGPPDSDRSVPRPRLYDRLDAVCGRKVTVVTGPPGSGKTTLVADWLASRTFARTAWLSAAQSCPAAFLPTFVAGSPASTSGAARPVRAARRAQGPGGVAQPRPDSADPSQSVLVVDDIHLLTEREVAVAFERQITRLPADVSVVLIGRHYGALSPSRLALQAQLAEIGGRELEFSPVEAAELIRSVSGEMLGADDLELLVQRTQGWAVGLRLAGFMLPELGGTQAVIDHLTDTGGPLWDYMEREITGVLPAGDVDLLTQASLVRRISPEFAEGVSGRPDAGRVLDSLVSQRFLIKRVVDPDGYELHPLFAEYLNRRLSISGRVAVSAAHNNSAEWCARSGDVDAALQHYVLAGRNDEALALGVSEVIAQLVTGPAAGGLALLRGSIPQSFLMEDPIRMYPLCVSLVCASRLDEAAQWIGRLESAIEPGAEAARQRARVECLRAMHDSSVLDADGVLAHSGRATRLVEDVETQGGGAPRPGWLPALDNAVWAVLPWIVARAHADAGRIVTARQVLEQNRHAGRQPGSAMAIGSLASVALAEGRLREVFALAQGAIEKSGTRVDSAVLRVESHVALAGAFFEQDRIGEAREHLAQARTMARELGLLRWTTVIEGDEARLSLSEGDPKRALRILQGVRRSETNREMSDSLDARWSHLEFRCRLAMGDVDQARDILDHIRPESRRAEGIVRLHLCAGRPDRAAAELARVVTAAPNLRDEIEMLLLRARANMQMGNPRTAIHSLQTAVELARPESFLRVFLDEPRQVRDSLEELHRGPDPFLDELIARGTRGSSAARPRFPAAMVEPLTERERELITFLPSHLTQYEIARQMYISPNTVKTHMKGLYRKLGANSRSDAVELAQTAGLL